MSRVATLLIVLLGFVLFALLQPHDAVAPTVSRRPPAAHYCPSVPHFPGLPLRRGHRC